ncbi:hypothetical protein AC1031_009258 [Aphanomyces cochlioides]|nr:hypothetical protein AC1031_009258 [Aphanomyces cochlioides]
MDEEVEQKMTFVLADIDAQFCKAHEAATQLLHSVRRHSQTIRQMHAHCRLFHDLFLQLEGQSTTLKGHSASNPRQDTTNNGNSSSEARNTHHDVDMERDDRHYDSFLAEEVDVEDIKLIRTTLQQDPVHRTNTPSHVPSLNDSNFTEPSPGLVRTPFMRKPPAPPANQHSPGHQADTSTNILPTPEIPTLSNHVQLQSPLAIPQPAINDSMNDLPSEVATPDLPTLARTRALESPHFHGPSPVIAQPPITSTSSPVSPRSNISATDAPRSPMVERSPQPTPGNDLRRRFSAAADYQTPRKTKTPRKEVDDDDLAFATIDSPILESPLLSTKLKVVTPHTPLSNRIAGATTSAPYRSPYVGLSPSTPRIPIFDLSLFPVAFQTGQGAYHLTRLYSVFRNDPSQAVTIAELLEKLDDCESERLQVLLDTLVSRGLIRPFVVGGYMYWKATFT